MTSWKQHWELEKNAFKPYPCGIVAHPAIDAATEASAQVGDPAKITAVEIVCHPLVPELMGRRQPEDGLQARFSAYHAAAVGLLDGQVGLVQFGDERSVAPDVQHLRDLITLVPTEGCARDEATIRVVRDGAEPVSVHVEHARGSRDRPLTDEELFDKVDRLVTPVLGADAAARHPRRRRPAGRRAGPRRPHRGDPAVRSDRTGDPALTLTEEVVDFVRTATPTPGALVRAGAELDRFQRAGEAGAASSAVRALERTGVVRERPLWTALLSGTAAAAPAAEPPAWVAVCAAATALDGAGRTAEAIAVGYVVAEGVAAALGDAHDEAGWYVPATAGTIGAAAAAGRILGLSSGHLRPYARHLRDTGVGPEPRRGHGRRRAADREGRGQRGRGRTAQP